MRLTEREKETCEQYSATGKDGKVNCNSCPLVIDVKYHICKANVSKAFIEKYYSNNY